MLTVRDFLMPDLGEGLTEGVINRWLVAEGDVVVVDQPVAEITTEKAVVEVPTPFAGRVATLHGAEGETITVGKPLISIEVAAAPNAEGASGSVLVGYGTSEVAPRSRRSAPSERPGGPASVVTAAMPPASPLVRRRAIELGIDLSTITGSGPGGMVSQADLERAARQDGEAPTATALVRADATRLMELRAELAPGATDASVTPFAYILRLSVIALRKFPRLNAHFDTQANEVVHFKPIHLGVAVQTDRGLVVVVIRDAQSKSLPGIADDLQRLATAARDGSIDATDLRGSTFTVSNFGAFGVDGGTAIINPPEAAILGVGRIATRPWVVDDYVVPRSVVELSLVFDHRVADGGVAGGFIRHLADLVEAPDQASADD